MPTAGAASSAIIDASLFMALIGCSKPSARNARRSTTSGRPTKSSGSARNWPIRFARCRISWMAKLYDCDISQPASDAQEAVQWTYLAYLGAIKEANGAAMSIGRISSFLDIFIERDLREGTLDEAGAQELWDQLVQKLRIVRFLRTPD